jgi:hypothetical protein
MTMIAYAFLQSRRLKQAKREKKKPWPAIAADPSCDPGGHTGHPQAENPLIPLSRFPEPALAASPEQLSARHACPLASI